MVSLSAVTLVPVTARARGSRKKTSGTQGCVTSASSSLQGRRRIETVVRRRPMFLIVVGREGGGTVRPRYLCFTGSCNDESIEDTRADEDEDGRLFQDDEKHRHYDPLMAGVAPGTKYPSAKNIPSARRRVQTRLGVTRSPFIEPIGATRENHYQCRLLLGLAWFCPAAPRVEAGEQGQQHTEWTFVWEPPPPEVLGGVKLEPEIMTLSAKCTVSFEEKCYEIESKLCSAELDAICPCCEGLIGGHCDSCRFAVGFHRCSSRRRDCGDRMMWKKGTLHLGKLDVQRTLFNLHRKMVPTESLHETAQRYVAGGGMTSEEAYNIMRAIEQERGQLRITGNEPASSGDPGGSGEPGVISPKMSPQELAAELNEREVMMRSGGDGMLDTDQWRSRGING